jgi:outer membrane protein insertion porin family
MRHLIVLLAVALAALTVVRPIPAQKFLPKSVQFKGDPEYTDQELMDAAGLKMGVVLDSEALNDASQRMLASGVFKSLLYKFDGQDVIFQLTPSTELFPVRLTNLPLNGGSDLDSKLHALFPLYHGKVPADGGLADDVRGALEQLLAAQGIKATVMAAASQGALGGKGGFVGYSVMAPPVVVGEIRLATGSAALDSGAQEILTKLTGSPYDLAGTPSQISTYLGNYYRDKGYVEAVIDAAPKGVPLVTPDAVKVPFETTVTPGIQYRLAVVQLTPGLAVSQVNFDKQSQIHPGDIADGQHVTENWEFIARQYHNHGFMRASVHPSPTFDRAKGTVSYVITVDPGPVYTMGNLAVENVSDDLRAVMLAAWKMPAGSVFDESAVRNFYAIGDINPTLKRIFAAVNCSYVLTLNDVPRTVDVALKLEKKH